MMARARSDLVHEGQLELALALALDSTASIPIPIPKRGHKHEQPPSLAPPVFPGASQRADMDNVEICRSSSSSTRSSSASAHNSPEMVLTPLSPGPALIYLGDDGSVQYSLADAPAGGMRNLQRYADQFGTDHARMVDDEGLVEGIERIEIGKRPEADGSGTPIPHGDGTDAEVLVVDYGVLEVRLTGMSNKSEEWNVPATAYIVADGVTIDMHRSTPEDIRGQIIATALRDASAVAPLMHEVESAVRQSMPGYVGLSALRPLLPAAKGDMVRIHHTSTATAARIPPAGVPRVILLNTLASVYLLVYPASELEASPDWVRFGCTLDLTPEHVEQGTAYDHPATPPTVKLSHDLFLRALRRVVGVASAPPPDVIRAMMRADAVGECQRHSDDSDGYDDYSDDESDVVDDFAIDPDMFGG